MKLAEVIHVLVNRLPEDWDHFKSDAHAAIDDHFGQPEPAATEASAAPPAETGAGA